MRIETERLSLRPLARCDTDDLTRVVFSDPDVVVMLAHDTRRPENARAAAAKWTRLMGIDGDGGIWDRGGLGLFAMALRESPDDFIGVTGTYMDRDKGPWSGELFYALGTNWHGQGLMGEAIDAIAPRIAALPGLGTIYGVYWDGINPASGRLLKRAGLRAAGRESVLSQYPEEKCRSIAEFDLWRLSRSEGEKRETVALQTARRIGAFVAEDLIDRTGALARLEQSFGGRLPGAAVEMLDWAIANPGMAYLELRGPEAKTTRSRNALA